MEQKTIFVFIINVLLSLNALASHVTFTASPNEVKVNLTDAAALRCDVTHDDVSDIQHISSIFVTSAEKDVASITHFSQATALADGGNLQVKGAIMGAKAGEGFLELSWASPSSMTFGEFTCIVTAVDAKGHTVTLNRSLEVTKVMPDLMDVVDVLNQRFDKQNSVISHQNDVITSLSQSIAKLSTCVKQRVAFTATIAKSGYFTINGGQTIQYDKVLVNDGSAYNSATGSFTCTVPGVYSFGVHTATSAGKYSCVNLMHNGNIITSAHTNSPAAWQGDFTGASVKLNNGDVVNVYNECRPSSLFQDSTGNAQVNIFTGHLVHADSCLNV